MGAVLRDLAFRLVLVAPRYDEMTAQSPERCTLNDSDRG